MDGLSNGRPRKITKGRLKAVVKDRLLHEDTLHTLLLEIERIVNSRP